MNWIQAVWDFIWQPGEEAFVDLIRDPNHWGLELVIVLIFDVLIGAVAWPIIKRHIHKDVAVAETHEHTQIDALVQRIAVLEGDEEGQHMGRFTVPPAWSAPERCHACGRAITQANPLQFYVGGMVGGCAACFEEPA